MWNRRDFLRASAVGAAGLALPTTAACSAFLGKKAKILELGLEFAVDMVMPMAAPYAVKGVQVALAGALLTVEELTRMRKVWKEHFAGYDERLGYAAVAPNAATKGMNVVIAALHEDRRETRPKTAHHCVTDSGDEGTIEVPSVVQMGLNELAKQLRKQDKHLSPKDVSVMSSIVSQRLTSGSDEITKPGAWRCDTGDGKNVEITWEPTTEVGKDSLLTVRRGLFVNTKKDEWEGKEPFEFPVPFGTVWALDKKGEAA